MTTGSPKDGSRSSSSLGTEAVDPPKKDLVSPIPSVSRSELWEHLAVTLMQISFACDKHPLIRSDVAGKLADEVIRQMEWARRPDREMQVIESWEQGGKRGPTIVRNLPLTLAPPDWKPE